MRDVGLGTAHGGGYPAFFLALGWFAPTAGAQEETSAAQNWALEERIVQLKARLRQAETTIQSWITHG